MDMQRLVAEAGVESLSTGARIKVSVTAKPALY
jgi:hypothetical protein